MVEYLDIKLKSIAKSDHRFLYQHLKERNPSANISHKKMPTYAEHVRFVMSRPYSKWYIIIHKNKKVGTIYLTKQNEIGIFIKNKMQDKLIGQKTLEILWRKTLGRDTWQMLVQKTKNRSVFLHVMVLN